MLHLCYSVLHLLVSWQYLSRCTVRLRWLCIPLALLTCSPSCCSLNIYRHSRTNPAHAAVGHHSLTTCHRAAFTAVALTALQFTPVSAAVGGMVLGIAALGKLAITGRILGISGIVGWVTATCRVRWGSQSMVCTISWVAGSVTCLSV